jgi:hypothetical protein
MLAGWRNCFILNGVMTLGEILDRSREIYVRALLEMIEANRPCFPEAAFCDENGVPVTEGPLAIPYRADLVLEEPGEVATAGNTIRVESPPQVKFSPISFRWEDALQVDMQSFQWDACDIQVNALSDVDWQPLRNWFLYWFDMEDQKPMDELGLSGVVHYLSDPEMIGAHNYRVQIDFGSAPVEAFEELLDALIAMGATSIGIG